MINNDSDAIYSCYMITENREGSDTGVEFINLTPHAINLNSGIVYPPSGRVARVSSVYSASPDENGIYTLTFGDVVDLPSSVEGVIYIVSAMVASRVPSRMDVVSPATGHKDCVRNEKGHIVSVPGFVKEV
jgi:hypothetical protein